MQGMTQQQLGDKVGVKFQQIHKYETGANRISASRMWGIAAALDVPVTFFFDGLEAYLNDQLWYFSNQVAPAA
jgi:transcriptional regulator with XRE-family HTH domain